MYTVKEVAEITGWDAATVRVYARKIGKGTVLKNRKQVFLFTCEEVRAFVLHRKDLEREKEVRHKDQIKRAKIVQILKDSGSVGVSKQSLAEMVKAESPKEIDRLVMGLSDLPIAEDPTMDDRLYWVGQ